MRDRSQGKFQISCNKVIGYSDKSVKEDVIESASGLMRLISTLELTINFRYCRGDEKNLKKNKIVKKR